MKNYNININIRDIDINATGGYYIDGFITVTIQLPKTHSKEAVKSAIEKALLSKEHKLYKEIETALYKKFKKVLPDLPLSDELYYNEDINIEDYLVEWVHQTLDTAIAKNLENLITIVPEEEDYDIVVEIELG